MMAAMMIPTKAAAPMAPPTTSVVGKGTAQATSLNVQFPLVSLQKAILQDVLPVRLQSLGTKIHPRSGSQMSSVQRSLSEQFVIGT